MKISDNGTRPASKAKCPSSRELVRSFSPKASRRSKDRIINHIFECGECRDAFSMLKDIVDQDAQSGPQEALDGSGGGRDRFVVRYATLAVGLLLIVTSVLFLVRRGDISRGHPAGGTSFSLSYPLSLHSITKPLAFRWEACPGADRYVLELFDESLLPVWTSGTTRSTQIDVANGAEIGLEAEESFFWTVTAYLGNDKIAESALARFTITR